jgi:hypothetical protein
MMVDVAHQFTVDEILSDSLKQEKIVELELRLANCAWLLANSRRILDRSAKVRRV